ncbi:hypothetical protein PV328_000950 [Microctonus aethiopoides]|uniref:RNA-directed DNA polymerase n=1 Tax=Microctonus aethiopoides TaxID=144406 RepID=A0AA39FWA8_9HYME|nr:hypothetical protein PV328_000950 [Microctonus aethiopoides]
MGDQDSFDFSWMFEQSTQSFTDTSTIQLASNAESVDECSMSSFLNQYTDLWFIKFEAQMYINKITSDDAKYNHLVSVLDIVTLSEIIDVIDCQPETNKYDHLKAAILRRYTDSVDQEPHMALTALQVEDKATRSGKDISYVKLLNDFIDITRHNTVRFTNTSNTVVHHIETVGQPVFEQPRRLNGEKLKIVKKEFDRLLYHGVIRPSNSQWASPIHMVAKKLGGWRITGDYKKLNTQTVPDSYPIPHGDDIFQRLHGSTVFSTIDLVEACHQIPVAQEDICKTAVTTPFGRFEFLGMPYGLRNGTQTLQRHMDNLLRDLDFVGCFIDDLIVYSRSHEEHRQHLTTIFNIFRAHKLTINLTKCQLGKAAVIYMGYSINKDGYKPPTDRIQAIIRFPKPETISDLRRFLGKINYYHKFIPGAAQIQAPLIDFLKNVQKVDKRKVSWTPTAEKALEACQRTIIQATRLAFLDPVGSLFMKTDTSDTTISAALQQLHENIWRPLAFFSRKLSPTETRYSNYDRELLAIFSAIKFFQHVLQDRHLIIQTNHKPIIYAFSQRADEASSRQLEQLDYISQFTTDIVYTNGKKNVVVDTCSQVNTINMPTTLDTKLIYTAQNNDGELGDLIEKSPFNLRRLKLEGHYIYCDISSNWVRPYIPNSLRREAFNVIHGLTHPSGRSTSKQLREKFVWPGIRKDVLLWTRQCILCKRTKVHQYNRLMSNPTKVPDNRFDHLHLDLFELPQFEDQRYCLSIIDQSSRWPVAIPLTNLQPDTVALAFFREWFCHFGAPLTFTTNQDQLFESRILKDFSNLMGMQHIRTTPYHPLSNSPVKQWQRTLRTALMCNSQMPWPKRLPIVLFGLRAAYHEDLKTSPAEMVFGIPLRVPDTFFVPQNTPIDPQLFIKKLKEHIRAIEPTTTADHTKSCPSTTTNLWNCFHVFKRVDSFEKQEPFEYSFTGPHEVVSRASNKLFIIKVNGQNTKVPVDKLKPAFIDKAGTELANSVKHNLRSSHINNAAGPSKRVSFAYPVEQVIGEDGCKLLQGMDVSTQIRQKPIKRFTNQACIPMKASKPSTLFNAWHDSFPSGSSRHSGKFKPKNV